MSRVLKFFIIMLFFSLVMNILLCLVGYKQVIYFIILDIVLFVFFVINDLVRKKIKLQREPFSPTSKIRNVDYLIIGGMFDAKQIVEQKDICVYITAPGRGERQCFEILKNTHSILKKNSGMVIMAVEKGKSSFSVFDVPFFHEIIIKRLKLGILRKISYFPLFFSPIKSIKFLCSCEEKDWKETELSNQEIYDFCRERNIKIRFFIKE